MSYLFLKRTDEEIEDLMWQLIRKKQHSIYKDFHAEEYKRIELTPDLKPMPVEMFRSESISERRDTFFKSLNKGDILYLQVINSLPDCYKLWVLAKYKEFVKVDDMLLVMYLPKWFFENNLLDKELEVCEFIRAAFCSASLHERRLYVTLDELIQEKEKTKVKFGRVSGKEIPHFAGILRSGLSYTGYFHHSDAFLNPKWARQMCRALDFDGKHVYSFFEKWDGKTYPESQHGPQLKERQKILHSNKYYKLAVENYEKKNVDKALVYLNIALEIWPKNVKALTTRGTVHANTNSLRKAFMDTEYALQIDSSFKPARKQMSAILVAAARTHIDRGNYEKAKESLKMSSSLDDNSLSAIVTFKDLLPAQHYQKTPFWEPPTRSAMDAYLGISKVNSYPSYSPSVPSNELLRTRRELKKHHRKHSRHHYSPYSHRNSNHHHHHKHSRDQRSRSKSPRRYSWGKSC